MKRVLLFIGPLLSLLGSLGFFMFGNALVGVFEVLTFRMEDPSLPSTLAEFHWAVVSASALVMGLVILSAAFVIRDSGRSISWIGRMMYVGAGLLLMIGAVFLIWSTMHAKSSFVEIATSSVSPTIESVREMIQSVDPIMTVGSALLGLSTLVLVVAGLVGFQTNSSNEDVRRGSLSNVFAMVSILIGGILLLLILSLRLNGNEIETLITESSVIFKPADLGMILTGIVNKSLLVFGGLAMMGGVQVLNGLLVSSARTEPKL
ncbi:MAG: hypothetical protein OSA98_09720 [Rubripirellula sp.]|nr:hypothetical protein [Rubripirellula sp.]